MNNKFRVWDIGKNEYSKKEYVIDMKGNLSIVDSQCIYGCPSWIDRENYIIEHSTGILDENGSEVYEGDIVKVDFEFPYTSPQSLNKKSGIGLICFDEKIACFYFSINDSILIIGRSMKNLNIIGNIHQNAELLNESKLD